MDNDRMKSVVERLSSPASYDVVLNKSHDAEGRLSYAVVTQIVKIAREILFPGYFGDLRVTEKNVEYYTGIGLEKLYTLLVSQIRCGYCFSNLSDDERDESCLAIAEQKAAEFIEYLPELRGVLYKDVLATYDADPAAKNLGEIIFAYPGIRAMINYRIAHRLFEMKIPVLPRIITEMAHSKTGIDIHPGAAIGEYFFMDHGTGIVIGETCIIGNHVSLYQGVTLGAKSFTLDHNGNPIKDIPRHPIIKDNVTIYAGATLLGRITVGEGAIIGGNVWLTEDVPAGAKCTQKKSSKI